MKNPSSRLSICVLTAVSGLLLLLSGCEPARDEATEFRVAGSSPLNSPWSLQWQRFADALAADERIQREFSMHVNGQLGDPERTIQSLLRGRVQLGGFPLSAAAGLVPEVALLQAPFLFESEAEVDHVIDNFLQPALDALFEAQGLTVLSWTEAGWNHLFSRSPIITPADIVNYPVRAQPTLGSRVLFTGLGADVRPIPYSDLMSSLQTSLVRGGDSNLVMYFAGGTVDEAPHLTLTGHVFDIGVILANRDWWLSLSAAERAAIRDALGPRQRLRTEVAEQAASLMQQAVAADRVTVHRPDAASMQQWRDLGPAIRRRLVEEIGGDAARIDALISAGQQDWAAAGH